ncbi:hypothetical protein SCHPADRAFT_466114 [Schizopora paradoxa]|uniref:Uncharacterized protein n=1 Tax=Schizopora paradoxa TaxID=27342 RepID=A0A0H2RQ25_9AGAM|nr:hypothetical protein SCHPADRAFT_466114 [Schizopora paradoxa]
MFSPLAVIYSPAIVVVVIIIMGISVVLIVKSDKFLVDKKTRATVIGLIVRNIVLVHKAVSLAILVLQNGERRPN